VINVAKTIIGMEEVVIEAILTSLEKNLGGDAIWLHFDLGKRSAVPWMRKCKT
jgi:hypothetical protein